MPKDMFLTMILHYDISNVDKKIQDILQLWNVFTVDVLCSGV